MPETPKGDLCVLDVQNADGECVHISRVVKHEGIYRSDVHNTVPFSAMDNWVAFSPDTWRNIQVYINELKDIIQNECQQ